MSSLKDSSVKELLEKATLATLLKMSFQRVYGKEEVQQIEKALKSALEDYSKKEEIYQNLYDENEDVAEALINEFLDSLCEKALTRAKDFKQRVFTEKLFLRHMNWCDDPRVKKLLETENLETLLKTYFQRVYDREDQEEVHDLERTLKCALEEYSKKERVYEKLDEEDNEADIEPLTSECLDSLCEETLTRAKDHTPRTLLTLAQLLVEIGDCQLSGEVIYCSALLSIQDFVRLHGLKVSLDSRHSKRHFALTLRSDIERTFSVFEKCHDSFYTKYQDRDGVKFALERANQFIQKLQTFELTDQKKQELENENFED